MSGALQGLRVVDASESVAGQYCGKLLSDFGAAVTLWEPPDGSATRRMPPLSPDGSSLLFLHLNWGKAGAPQAAALPGGTDIALLPAGADHAAMRAQAPRLITCTVSDFGEDGPRADWTGGEMIHQALSGVMYRNGHPQRTPLYGCGRRTAYVAGVAAYSAVLAAVLARARTGRGQHLSIDLAETAASMTYAIATQYNYNRTLELRSMPSNLPSAVLRCADGWVAVFLYAYRWAACCAALGREDLTTDPRFATAEERMANWKDCVAQLQATVAALPADQLVTRLQGAGCVAAKAARPSQLGESEHLAARGYWEQVGGRSLLGPPWRMEKTPRRPLAQGTLP